MSNNKTNTSLDNTSEKMPSVGVVVLNWNGKNDTVECLKSLYQCSYQNMHIYVVDNASSDGSVEVIKQAFAEKSNLIIIESGGNLGFSGGNNVGSQRAIDDGMEFVLLLNNDTEVDSGFIEPLVNVLKKDDSVGVVTSKIYFANPSKKLWFFGGFMDRNSGLGGPVGGQAEDVGQLAESVECDYATGCVLMAKSTLLKKIGLLDDDYFYLCEDADFCFRVSDVGLKIKAIAESIVWHKVSASLEGGEESPFRLYFRARNQMMLVSKNKKNYKFYKHGLFLFKFHSLYLARRVLKGMPFKGTLYYIWGLWDYFIGRTGNISK